MALARRRQAPIAARRLILDSGVVIAWSRGDVRARAAMARALELGVDVRIPIAVLAETLRGGPRDAAVHRVRNAVDVFPTDEPIGRLAGVLLGAAGGASVVDALVAAEAVITGADVLTSDVQDLGGLLAGHPKVAVIAL
jgi:predicted nucleic acid-binding protein